MKNIVLSQVEKDILAEIGNMCVGNATTALAQILGRRVELELPSVKVIGISQLHTFLGIDKEEPIIGIHMQILGGAKGSALMIFPRRDAYTLVDLLVGSVAAQDNSFTEIGISALKEVGNIVVSSYLSALSAFTGISSFPSTVTMTSGVTRNLTNMAFAGPKKKTEDTILVEAVFRETKRNLSGNFFIIFDAASITVILKRAKTMIRGK